MLQQPLSHRHTNALQKVSFIHSLYPKSNFHFLQGNHICSVVRRVGVSSFEHSPASALPLLPSSGPQALSRDLSPTSKTATNSDKAEASASAETDGICPRKLFIQHSSTDKVFFALLEHIPAAQHHDQLPARGRWLPS